jgi:hypothetical protein
MNDRSMIGWLVRGRRWRAARILAGVAVALFGVLVFLTPSPAPAHGTSPSPMITMESVLLVAGGLVVIVGPDKINERAKRNRRR